MIIGIGGASRSGKSYLSGLFAKELSRNEKKPMIISIDDFVKDKSEMSRIKGELDWEHPGSYDWNRIQQTLKSKSENHTVIYEGFLAFYKAEVTKLIDHKIWIYLDKSEFLKRRLEETRWGHEPYWYLEYVWQSHLQNNRIPKETSIWNGNQIQFWPQHVRDYSSNLIP